VLKALDNLVKTGQLKVEPTAKSELAGFLANAGQALADARISALSSANRFKLAYDAAHALALAAMRAHGYARDLDPATASCSSRSSTRLALPQRWRPR
jgi:hypothetical protein